MSLLTSINLGVCGIESSTAPLAIGIPPKVVAELLHLFASSPLSYYGLLCSSFKNKASLAVSNFLSLSSFYSVSSHCLVMTLQTTGIALVAVVYFIIRYLNKTDYPKIKGIPEIPGVPLFGNLLQFGDSHARVAGKLAKKFGPVFQVRLGNRVSSSSVSSTRRHADTRQRIIFANTFDSVKQLWITNQSALISRPTLHTFHTVVSSSQGFTIGTSPWDESCKQRRKAAATALNRPAVQSYMPIVDLESNASIKELLEDSCNGTKDVDPIAYFQRFALNTSLTLNYGSRIDGKIDSELLQEICEVERAISNFRSTSNNWQDYIPLMRLLPVGKASDKANEYRERRDKYLTFLLTKLKKQIKEGSDKPCITGNILKDPEAKLNESQYNPFTFSNPS
jgi:phenylacetate 2-hydroxylase